MINDIKENIELIIERLGYTESDNLFYYDDLYKNKKIKLSLQTQKNLKDIKPYAFYCIDNRPFILFFSKIENKEERQNINKKIWNMQIPVVIFDNIDCIQIFNGSNLDFEKKELFLIQENKLENMKKDDEFSYWNINTKSFWNDMQKYIKIKN